MPIRKSKIKFSDRIRICGKEEKLLSFKDYSSKQEVDYKPKGLWYSMNTEWIEWCETEEPDWIGNFVYKLKLNLTKILIIKDLPKFTSEFSVQKYDLNQAIKGYTALRYELINWPKIASQYSGIEIPQYSWKYRHEYMWFYGWDVASGCVWNPSAILKFERI